MTWFLYIVSMLWAAVGSLLILHTEKVRDVLSGVLDEADLRLYGGVLAGFGVLLGISSFWSGVTWFLLLLSLTITGMGAYAVFGDESKVKTMVDHWIALSDAGYRLWGLIFVISAVALLAWI